MFSRIVGFIRSLRSPAPSAGRPTEDDVEHYLHLRRVIGDVYGDILDTLPRRAAREVAGALDIPGAAAVCIRPEGMIDPYIDGCVFSWVEDGRNMVRRYADDASPLRDPDAREVLDAMLRARFLLAEVEEIVPGIGARVRDGLTGEALERPENVFAVLRWCRREVNDAILVPVDLRPVLVLGEMLSAAAGPDERIVLMPPRRPSRNAPCPCGSGRLHKRRCGRTERRRRSA